MFKKIKEFFTTWYAKRGAYKKKNAEREAAVYVVLDNAEVQAQDINDISEINLENLTPITFTPTMESAVAAVDRLYYIKHGQHYNRWCDIRQIDEKERGFHTPSWKTYETETETGLVYEDDYRILQLIYTITDFAGVLRLMSACEPLFLPHEKPEELRNYLLTTIQKTEKLTIPENISALMNLESEVSKNVQHEVDSILEEVKRHVDVTVTTKKTSSSNE